MRPTLRHLAASALGLLLLAGVATACGSDSDGSAAADPAVAADRPSSGAPPPPPSSSFSPSSESSEAPGSPQSSGAVVPAVLDFTGTGVDGSSFDGASLAGKPAVVWFWAPWCPVCKSQIPQVQEVAADFSGRAGVVGIGSLDDTDAIAGFADEAPGVTMLQDPDGDLWKHFGITEQSTFVVLDASGREVARTSYGEGLDLDALLTDLVG